MKNECNIIRDLLPLYAEDMVSEDSKEFVEEHLAKCESCKKELEEIKNTERTQIFEAEKPLRTLKSKLLKKGIIIGLLTVLITVVIENLVATCLTTPKYIQYPDNIYEVYDNRHGAITVKIPEAVNTKFEKVEYDPNSDINNYLITRQTISFTEKDSFTDKTYIHFASANASYIIVHYNNENKTLLYGKAPEYLNDVPTLQSAIITYYIVFSTSLLATLFIISLLSEKIFKNTKLITAINFIIPIPASIIIAFICYNLSGWEQFPIEEIHLFFNLGLTIIIFGINSLFFDIIKIVKETKEIKSIT